MFYIAPVFNNLAIVFLYWFFPSWPGFWQLDCERNHLDEMHTNDKIRRTPASEQELGPDAPAATTSMDNMARNRSFGEDVFQSMLTLERRRAERSGQPFALMLLSAPDQNGSSKRLLHRALGVVAKNSRETD